MTAHKRRSFSQANLAERHEGELGGLLLEALRVPPEEGYAGTHAFHPYAGRFHPALPRTLLAGLLQPGQRVLDPFMGGGTTLVEALAARHPSAGSDLNPIALVVARERTRMRSEAQAERVLARCAAIADQVSELHKTRSAPRVQHPRMRELTPQYPPHLLAEMLQWIRLIDEVHDSSVRETLRAVFSAGCVKFSNRRSDTSAAQSLTPYPKGAVSRFMRDKAGELTRAQVLLGQALLPDPPAHPLLRQEDARLLPSFGWGEFDLVLTSPPYPGTYDYVEHHALRMAWLNLDEAPLRGGEIGARRDESQATWSADNRDVMVALARVLKPGGLLCVVIGDWLVEGHPVDGGAQLLRAATDKGWRLRSRASIRREVHSHKEQRAYRKHGKWEHLLALGR
ncbi:MAG: hypothetical protein HY342_08150 [Candidatus Lambdaproteobacteria bacterium]|nr:hypothetical protein [Candidatus Lambdaproteobacteria bacterium]